VKQPHGPGTLPITFDFGEVVETVTATHSPNSISFKMSMRSCNPGCFWFGQIYRAANLVMNGSPQSYFGTSATAALAYFQNGVVFRNLNPRFLKIRPSAWLSAQEGCCLSAHPTVRRARGKTQW
jgi:hypothetical protein